MKKYIAAFALALSCSFSAMAVQFDHWTANSDHIIAVAPLENSTVVSVIIYNDMSTAVGIMPKGNGFGQMIHEESAEFSVDGQPIKAKVRWYDNGSVLITPVTEKGSHFLANSFWAKSKVTIKFKEFDFWLSGKGVQKAWKYLHSRKQAI